MYRRTETGQLLIRQIFLHNKRQEDNDIRRYIEPIRKVDMKMANKKGIGIGVAVAAGAGAAAYAAKNHKKNEAGGNAPHAVHKKAVGKKSAYTDLDYRNTELGRYDKNSKGIYYTNGNYEAFARPKKPEGVDEKNAYIVGSGLAALAAACFLVRDGQMPGSHIHILEAMDIAGGACDGINDPARGYVMRGGREMENHFECLWDLFRSIPSIETPGVSVLDEYYWLNKEDARCVQHGFSQSETPFTERLTTRSLCSPFLPVEKNSFI